MTKSFKKTRDKLGKPGKASLEPGSDSWLNLLSIIVISDIQNTHTKITGFK